MNIDSHGNCIVRETSSDVCLHGTFQHIPKITIDCIYVDIVKKTLRGVAYCTLADHPTPTLGGSQNAFCALSEACLPNTRHIQRTPAHTRSASSSLACMVSTM